MIQDFPAGFKEGSRPRLAFSANYDIMIVSLGKTRQNRAPARCAGRRFTTLTGLRAGERRDPVEEFFTRLQVIFSQLGDQVRAAMESADPGNALGAAIDVILPVACGVLRVLAVIVAILIITRCIMSLFRDRPGKEIWGWLAMSDGTRLDLYHWENTLGRGRWADVSLDFPTVSRSHAALLRDDKGNWKLQPLQTKNGTRLNGKKVTHTVPVKTGDVVDLGGIGLSFYAISEEEEREQAVSAARASAGRADRALPWYKRLWCRYVLGLL